jgi:hypothetical protein
VQWVHGKRALSQRARAELKRVTRKDPGPFEFLVQWLGFPSPIDFSWVNANDMQGGAQGALDMMEEHKKNERLPQFVKLNPPSPHKPKQPDSRAHRPLAERGVQRRSARSRRSNSLTHAADAPADGCHTNGDSALAVGASESTMERPRDALLPPVPAAAAAAAAAAASIPDDAAAVAALQLRFAQLDQERGRLRQEQAELLVQERDRLRQEQAELLALPGCPADPQPAASAPIRTSTLVHQQASQPNQPSDSQTVAAAALVRTRSQRSSNGAPDQPQRTPS